jgi:hypothetical protein
MTTVDEKINIIQNYIIYPMYIVYNYIRCLCKYQNNTQDGTQDNIQDNIQDNTQDNIEDDIQTQFINACNNGNLDIVKLLSSKNNNLNFNQGLEVTCKYGHVDVAEWLIDEKKADNLNDCLKISCQNNRYPTSELLVIKGADTLIGLRHTSSVNIRAMLYRYKQGVHMI